MRTKLRALVASLILVSGLFSQAAAAQTGTVQAAKSPTAATTFSGRWRVKFRIGVDEKNLIVESKANGSGHFQLLDSGPNEKAVTDLLPAAWSQLTNDRVSFSGEIELAIGNCSEWGTLMFKGRFESSTSLSGKLVFVTSVDEEESPYKFHSSVGTFTATRVLDRP